MDDTNHTVLGFTLVELLTVISIIGLLAMIAILALRGETQIQKAQDSRRKGDLSKTQRCLEEYYNDHGYYLPTSQYACGGSGLSPCMPKILCDPYGGQGYTYQTDGSAKPGWYKLYTNLRYASDPLIGQAGCSGGCPAGGSIYNYVVSSPNASGGSSCQGPIAPICSQPQNYVGVCASCCPGAGYRVQQIDGFYYCCMDATCQ